MSGHSAPPKFSRYRSVRINGRNAQSAQAVDGKNAVQDGGVKKAPSRYHRPAGKPPVELTDAPPMPQVPRAATLPMAPRHNNARYTEEPENIKEKAGVRAGDERSKKAQRLDLEKRAPLEELESEFKSQGRKHAQALESAREVGRDEAKRVREGEGIQRARTVPVRQMSEEDAAEILEIQKRKDLERLEKVLDAASSSPPKSPSPSKERFHLFSRKKSKETPPSSASTSRRTSPNVMPEAPKLAPVQEKPQHIEVGGGGIVPGTDAPISAVNSGERRIVIRCKQSSINLAVTPTTTPNEIIYTAANIMSQTIDPDKAILLESYAKLGLERGIRRYEHVRDIMNSWDRDTQNALIIEPSPTTTYPSSHPFSNVAYLKTDYVPSEAPRDISVYLYHSQKPGKWNKRHVTLASTGHIFISKSSNAKISDKDSTTICNLSDFDIFIPTSSERRKNLKPPKKTCYAIKSQQKTTFFESTENFVHFFSSDDEELSRNWWSSVQRWRSWYLMHNRGRSGKKEPDPSELDIIPQAAISRANTKRRPNTRAGAEDSTTKTPYTIGSFEPLLGTADFSSTGNNPRRRSRTINSSDDIPRDTLDDTTKQSSRKYPPITSALLTKIHSNHSTSSIEEDKQKRETFAPQGLLGRSYTVKQREIKDREDREKKNGNTKEWQVEGPFVSGKGLLNSGNRPKTSGSMVQGLGRSNTQKMPPPPLLSKNSSSSVERTRTLTMTGGKKPLVDLSKPKEVLVAKQWSGEGKGRGVRVKEGVLLVEGVRTKSFE